MADSIRVLHVDDDPAVADLAGTFLEREDERLRVETATSAGEAADRLADGGIDCIVSDYDMPGKTGVEFLEDVREAYPDLPFILFTGKGSEEVASEAVSAGVTDYIQKETGTEQYQLLAKRVTDAVEHRYAETNYEEIFEKMPEGVLIQDPTDGSFVDMNERYAELFGYDREALLAAGFEAIHPGEEPYTLENARERVREAVAEGPVTFEWPGVRKDDTRFWAQVHLAPIRLHGEERLLAVVRDATDRRERERRFEAIFDNTHTFVGLLEPDGTVLEANETALSFGGLDRAEVVGKPLWETGWFRPVEEARSAARRAIERAREGDLFREEIRVQGGDREAVIDFSVRPITDERGEVTLLVPEGREITERTREERKREQIVRRVTDAIVEVDAEWRFTLVNDQAETLYGMEETDLLGREFWDVFESARDTRFETEYRAVMQTREPTTFVEYYEGLDGWFEIQVYPNDDGGIAFYFREVTDRRERQRELEQYETIVETVPDGVYVLDEELQFTRVNDALVALTGYDRAELLGSDVSIIFEESAVEAAKAKRDRLAAGDSGFGELETEIRTADGERVPCEIRGRLLPSSTDGEHSGTTGVIRDVTDRKRDERRLERQNERLEEFASVVSHDLRNPLNVAHGRIELAREDCESPHLADAASAVERSHELVDDLLALARQGEEVGDREPVVLADVAENCWETVETEQADLAVEVERTVRADRNRLKQLLENLFRNAAEHAGPEVTVTVGDFGDGFYVADDGPGIPPDERDTVFEAGYSTRDEGTGFGLRIVRRVVRAHDWEIEVTESAWGGARFEVMGVAAGGDVGDG